MYAVIETGGKQYQVRENEYLRVEKLNEEVGTTVTFDKVLLLGGEDLKVGTPYVEGAKVVAEVEEHGKGKKVVIGRFKRKKNYRRRKGHRQPYTQIRIKAIQA